MARRKGEVIAVRVEDQRRARYEAAAEAQGVTLPDWVRATLDVAAGAAAPALRIAPPSPDQELDEAANLCRIAYSQDTPEAGARLAVKMLGTALAEGIDPLGFPGARARLERAGHGVKPFRPVEPTASGPKPKPPKR